MIELIDKTVIFLSCLLVYLFDAGSSYNVVPIIISSTLSSLNSYFDKRILRILFIIGYIFLCQFYPVFLMFIPLICYDIFVKKEQLIALLILIPCLTHMNYLSYKNMSVVFILIAVSYLLKYRTHSLSNLRKQYMLLRDTTKERSILMEKKNSELMEKQDYEINMATLNERNRIAMEIHDNVGHLLSRCLLQLGALMAINKEEKFKESLSSIKNTLSQAMDSIRSSVHNLHEESIDLKSQITSLVKNFDFCPISLDYDITENVEKGLKYCFISIVNEALSNIIKHSKATEVSVTLREHPALYQLIIQDNGKVTEYNMDDGIGLNNITERVRKFSGIIHINVENGFKIFISVPKRKEKGN